MQDKTSNLLRIIFLKIGLVIFMKVITISEAEVTLTPSTRNITENSPVTLRCSYTGNLTVAAYFIQVSSSSSQTPTQVGSLLTDCSVFAVQPDPALYEYSCLTSSQLSWTIKNVTRANDGETWKCLIAFSLAGSEKANITINVQVPIQNIVMTNPTNNVVTVQENTETVFVCKTSGLPAATVKWYKGAGITTDHGEITSFATTSSSTIDELISVKSTLRYSPRKGDNGMKIYCTARNSASTLTSSRKPKLNVQYSPDGPPTIQNFDNDSTCYVIENIQRTLSCSVNGGNPLATLSWTCFNSGFASASVGSTVTKTVTFTASRRQDRSCTCQSSHPMTGMQSVTVNVQVLYPPESPTFKVNGKIASGTIKFIEGKTRTVDCESHGKPNPNSYTWTRGSQTTSITTGKTLTLTNIQRKDEDQFTCTVENTMIPSDGLQQTGRNSTTVKVSVLYAPTNILLYYGGTNEELITGNSIDVVKNETFKIECKSDGQPPPKYTWSGQTLDNQSILVAVIDADTNKTCTATNTMSETYGETKHGSFSTTLTLNVVYKATVISFVIEGREELEDSSFTVNEKDNIQFVCTVDSKPNSNIGLAFQDKMVHRQNMTNILRYNHMTTSCLDAGIYTCFARNKYNSGNDASATLQLRVKCSPRPLRQIKGNFTSSLNDTVTLTFTTLAYPEPGKNGFNWYKQNSFTWIPLLSNTDLLITSSGLETNLTIKRVFMSDFGHYRVTVTNDIGKYDQYLYLVEKREQSSTDTIKDFDKTGQSSDDTGYKISVTLLGVLFTAVTLYAVIMTIYFKRKLMLKETHVSASKKQTTYTNLSFPPEDTTEAYSRPSGDGTTAAIDYNDDSVQQYTDLVHYSNVDQKTYDVIQNT